jgi:spoIIIJ-associated protein
MNSCREFEGKNVEKAIELACQELNISRSQLKYDIISNGSSGIFSIIRNKKARIRVNLESTAKNKQRVISLVDEAFGVKSPQPEKEKEKNEKQPPKEPLKAKARPEKKPARPPVQEKKQTVKPDPVPVFDDEDDDEKPEKIISEFFKGKTADVIGEEVLRVVLKYFVESFDVNVETDDENLIYHISSEDSSVIIGKRGQNLEAIQYIVDKIVNKHTLERRRVLIDVEGYLEKRRENLEKMALRMAEKVKKSGKPSTISQMSSQDRRIVHLALKDDKGVRTQSMGEGYYRRLVIFPKKSKSRKKPE